MLDGRSRSADDDLAELATNMLRSPAVEHLRGPDAIALVMIAAGTGELSAGALDVKLGKLQCHPSLRARIDKLVIAALDAGVVRMFHGRVRGDLRSLRARVRRIFATPHAATRATPLAATATATRPPAGRRPSAIADPVANANLVDSALSLRAPPSFAPARTTMSAPTAVELASALRCAAAEQLDAVVHTLEAHLLAVAEQFDELLAIPTLRGVASHRYQIETARRVLRALRGRALLADEVGLGKTIEAIMVLREYQLRGMARRVLVLTPPALVHHWRGELAEKADITALSTDDPRARTDPDGFWSTPGVIVASLATARAARNAPIVQRQPWDLVVVDEAHHVKRRSTLAWKLVDGLRSRFLLLLTATPIENDLDEIYSLVTLLRPGHFATASAFRAQFVDAKDPTSPRNRERLRALLGEVMVRNTRAGCGLGLPPRFVTTVLVDPLPAERALYDDVLAFVRAHRDDGTSRMLATVLLLEAGSSPAAVRATLERARPTARPELSSRPSGPETRAALLRLAERAALVTETRKRDALVGLLAAHPDEQVLVFTRYRATAGFLAAVLAGEGIEHVRFEGGQSPSERAHALAAFARGDARVMLATDVGGEGQNLQHCHVLVNFDLPWNPMLVEQRIGRLHRMGQTSEVRVYNLAARATIEDRVLEVLDRRLHLFELVVGEMDMVLGNLTDERDLEERILAMVVDAPSEAPIDAALDAGFDAIEQELRSARGRYERTKALDEALFGEDFET